MSNKCFLLAGFIAIIGSLEVMYRLRCMQEVKTPICLTVLSCTMLLTIGVVLSCS